MTEYYPDQNPDDYIEVDELLDLTPEFGQEGEVDSERILGSILKETIARKAIYSRPEGGKDTSLLRREFQLPDGRALVIRGLPAVNDAERAQETGQRYDIDNCDWYMFVHQTQLGEDGTMVVNRDPNQQFNLLTNSDDVPRLFVDGSDFQLGPEEVGDLRKDIEASTPLGGTAYLIEHKNGQQRWAQY